MQGELKTVADRCTHFGDCGGCAAQDVPYEDQVAAKQATLQQLLEAHWKAPIPIEPAPSPWYYRNRIDLQFGPKHYPEAPPKGFIRESVLGFKRQGRWYWPLEVDECRIYSPELPGLLPSVRRWMADRNLTSYSSRQDNGLLRILLCREGKRTGERMVVITTRTEDLDAQSFADAVLSAYPATSVQWGVFSGKAEITAADTLHVLHGPPVIHEELHVPTGTGTRRLRFSLSPLSFFQTNTLATEVLYAQLRRWVEDVAPDTLYDLYGGSGGIALTCSDVVPRIVSVESYAPASADGLLNARANAVDNVEFLSQPVEDYLRDRAGEGRAPEGSAAIVDPPRAGMHPKAIRRLLEWRPARLLYVSCKPTQFALELESLKEAYDLTDLHAVDLFPHTPHVELIASFTARP